MVVACALVELQRWKFCQVCDLLQSDRKKDASRHLRSIHLKDAKMVTYGRLRLYVYIYIYKNVGFGTMISASARPKESCVLVGLLMNGQVQSLQSLWIT